MSLIKQATIDDVNIIVDFLCAMQNEIDELPLDKELCRQSVTEAINSHVHYFLFTDETGEIFGTCFMQTVHNYWRLKKRFYLGGLYIQPCHRGQGYYKKTIANLKEWAMARNGMGIYAYIHHENEKSLGAAASVNMNPIDWHMCFKYFDDD